VTEQSQLTDEIIRIGKLLWDKGLVCGFNGNISVRVDANTLLITATGTCLGYLNVQDILLMNISGGLASEGPIISKKPSSESLMHTEIYKNFPQIKAVVHTHPTYTNGFFLAKGSFTPKTFEAKFYLGEVKSIEQTTPSVTDMVPVIKELKANNIVILRNHGVVAVGPDLFHAFVLIQELEEQVKMDLVAVHYLKKDLSFPNAFGPQAGHSQSFVGNQGEAMSGPPTKVFGGDKEMKKYKLFSPEQIQEIVRLVNSDLQMQELGKKTAMNMDLAVCLQETGDIYSFKFENGRITKTGQDAQAEFLITAHESIWRAVFNREIDPFVATTQKKMDLRGDFARISKWYAPCSRIFQLWTEVPVE